MSQPIIQIQNLGKRFRIGTRERYHSLRDSIARAVTLRGVRQAFRRSSSNRNDEESHIWALREVNLEVQPGEVIGIIGRNGAGKSTLLKTLSRITEPTEGQIEMYGRVGSLLEVGTGFHPELTGRENVFLNGAILGMARTEIKAKFDEIVAFAEVEKFIDTAVKHYSSGMYMRLAFAVAAHLEPEILIVDEVLAVGDAAFQKKCLGKMGEVARHGRTVLFVSHNMQAVSQLTSKVLILAKGRSSFEGPTAEGVARYTALLFADDVLGRPYVAEHNRPGIHLAAARVATSGVHGEQVCTEPIVFEFDICVDQPRDGLCFSFQIVDSQSRPVCHFWLLDRSEDFSRGAGIYRLRCSVPRFRLYMGRYALTTYLSDRRGSVLLEVLNDICPFEVTMRGIAREEYDWQPGAMTYWEDCEWSAPKPIQESSGVAISTN